MIYRRLSKYFSQRVTNLSEVPSVSIRSFQLRSFDTRIHSIKHMYIVRVGRKQMKHVPNLDARSSGYDVYVLHARGTWDSISRHGRLVHVASFIYSTPRTSRRFPETPRSLLRSLGTDSDTELYGTAMCPSAIVGIEAYPFG